MRMVGFERGQKERCQAHAYNGQCCEREKGHPDMHYISLANGSAWLFSSHQYLSKENAHDDVRPVEG